ncbi:unnamed protein product [Cunninghamella blakesleeana]
MRLTLKGLVILGYIKLVVTNTLYILVYMEKEHNQLITHCLAYSTLNLLQSSILYNYQVEERWFERKISKKWYIYIYIYIYQALCKKTSSSPLTDRYSIGNENVTKVPLQRVCKHVNICLC